MLYLLNVLLRLIFLFGLDSSSGTSVVLFKFNNCFHDKISRVSILL